MCHLFGLLHCVDDSSHRESSLNLKDWRQRVVTNFRFLQALERTVEYICHRIYSVHASLEYSTENAGRTLGSVFGYFRPDQTSFLRKAYEACSEVRIVDQE
jgi:hypothetical protein